LPRASEVVGAVATSISSPFCEKSERVTTSPNEQEIKPTESISIFSVHFTLNLPQASRLLGMTKRRGSLRGRDRCQGPVRSSGRWRRRSEAPFCEKSKRVTTSPNEQEIKPTESISIFSVHFTLNLPQASRLLGMTKERVVARKGRLLNRGMIQT
jgi:hypothetical protein